MKEIKVENSDNWKQEEEIIKIAQNYMMQWAKEDPESAHNGEIPEFAAHHGEGDPEGLIKYLKELAEKMPNNLAKRMMMKIDNVIF